MAILAGGVALKATTPEYHRLMAQLRRTELSRWQLLGQDRYERSEIEQWADERQKQGIIAERISQRDKGRMHVPAEWIDTRIMGVILGRLRKSAGLPGEDPALDDGTVRRWCEEGLIPAVKRAGRWWSTREATESVTRVPNERKRGRVQVGCNADGCGEVVKRRAPDGSLRDPAWAEVYEIRDGEIVKRHVYCSIEHVLSSRNQWERPRGATIMAPCTCLLDPDDPESVHGVLTRVRIGREYQVEDGWVRCPDCAKAKRSPDDYQRSKSSREKMSKAHKAAFANGEELRKVVEAVHKVEGEHGAAPKQIGEELELPPTPTADSWLSRRLETAALLGYARNIGGRGRWARWVTTEATPDSLPAEPWAEKQRERFAKFAEEILRSPNRLVAREEARLGRLSAEQRRRLRRKANSRARRDRAGRKPSRYGVEWAARYADILDYHERRAAIGEPMPSTRAMCFQTALEDSQAHPDDRKRWPYRPEDAPEAALKRVQAAIKKVLQPAGN